MHLTLKLDGNNTTQPRRFVTKDEFFDYIDNVFSFFSKPRSSIEYLVFNAYVSTIHDSINGATESPSVETECSSSLVSEVSNPDPETVRIKRLAWAETRTFCSSSPQEAPLTEINPPVANKPDKFKGLLKLPAWASERTRELRAQHLGISIDEV